MSLFFFFFFCKCCMPIIKLNPIYGFFSPWNLMEAKSICKVGFGYIFTFFGAEVGLVANKFWGETGVLDLHPGWATFDTDLWQNEGQYYFTEAGEGMPNSAPKKKVQSWCNFPPALWSLLASGLLRKWGQCSHTTLARAFTLCSDQSDLATLSK